MAAVGVVVAVSGDGDDTEQVSVRTATPSPAVEAPTRTPRRTATASPAPVATVEPTPEVDRPDPQSLLKPGYALDQSLDVNMDGSETGQIVVVSHTVRKDKDGNPLVNALPEVCAPDPVNGSPCAFRIEVFAYDQPSGWMSRYVDDHANQFAGAEQDLSIASFILSNGNRQALIVTSDRATGIGSGTGLGQTILSMERDEIRVVYASDLKATVQVDTGVAVITEPHFAETDPFCCPSGHRITRVGLDAATGEVRVLGEQIVPLQQ